MSFFQNLKAKFSLKKELHRLLCRPLPKRPMTRIHGSMLTSEKREYCPREAVLHELTGYDPGMEHLSAAMSYTFNMGRMLEEWLQHILSDILYGNWHCTVCGDDRQLCKKPSHCGRTDCVCEWRYRSMRFTSPVTGASCEVDLLIDTGAPKLKVVESKSIDKDEARKLSAPYSEHRLRTNLYMRIIDDAGYGDTIDTKSALVFYMAKCFGFKDDEVASYGFKDSQFSPFKEFTVMRNDDQTDLVYSKALAVHNYRLGVGGIPCGVCDSINDKRAMSCPVKKECFSGKYPPIAEWR